jgi:hypothetical protein
MLQKTEGAIKNGHFREWIYKTRDEDKQSKAKTQHRKLKR